MKHVKGERNSKTRLLSEAHRALLDACLCLGTDDTQKLARFLYLAPVTVKTYFARILKVLDKSTRAEVILWYATQQGLLLPGGGEHAS